MQFNKRFRGLLPVVVDVETAGFNAKTDALLEIAIVPVVAANDKNELQSLPAMSFNIKPFVGANLEPAALDFINVPDPEHPFRFAIDEKRALEKIFQYIHELLNTYECHKAVLVGHNSWFDLTFLLAAVERCKLSKSPFHSFTTFDTATLGAMFYGQTILAKILRKAGFYYDVKQAHSALYDAKITARLFCNIYNKFLKNTII